MKSYRIDIWFRTCAASIPILYGAYTLLRQETSVFLLAFMMLLSFLVFLFLSFRIVLRKNELYIERLYLWKAKLIPLEKISSIDAHKELFQVQFYLRANPTVARRAFYVGFDNVLVLHPLINNRVDLIKSVLERNPSITIDTLTNAYITGKKSLKSNLISRCFMAVLILEVLLVLCLAINWGGLPGIP